MKPLDLSNAVILDTETTGLDKWAQVIEVSIIDALHGNTIYTSLICPSKPIPVDATDIHGITYDDVRHSPTIADAWHDIRTALSGRDILIYNADFDTRLLLQSLRYSGLEFASFDLQRQFINELSTQCVMLWYADFYQEEDPYHGDYKWQRLTNACVQQEIDTSDLKAHRASADCEMTRRLVHAVNAQLQA
ncbi:3'-5' exonuclease [Vibrio mexicanus]|uniref:3'-5' exonuclease n=1 Tax=Vibrio mexicanus TaxID=1004326 RepID=UPI00063C0AD3|nr:3'-5' exonuclease [Vibrio mexicanus]